MTSARDGARQSAHLWLPGLVALAFLGAWTARPAPLQRLRRVYFDFLNRERPRPHSDARVLIVDIDDESLAKLGQWPWPRTLDAKLVDRLRALGASVVALNVIFGEPDRTSPRQSAADIPPSEGWKALKARFLSLPDHDEVMAKSLAGGKVVLGFAASEKKSPPPAAKAAVAGSPPAQEIPGAVADLPSFQKAAAGSACSTIIEDEDGVIRRMPLFFSMGAAIFPDLALETLRVGSGKKEIDGRAAPADPDGALRLYFEAAPERERFSAWRILDPAFSGRLDGRFVIIGLSAAGLQNLHTSPMGGFLSDAEVHAQTLEQIIARSFLTRPGWAKYLELCSLLGFCAAIIVLMPRVGPAWGGLAALAFAFLLWSFSLQAYSDRRWLIDPVLPTLAVAGAYLSSTIVLHLKARAERRKLELQDKLKDELISTVSHDLRGPVASVIMYLDAILAGAYGPITDKQKSMLTILRDSTRRLTFFINNILDAARIKNGRMQYLMKELRAEDLFAEADGLYLSAAGVKKVELVHSVAPDVPAFEGDREKLEQVVNNLVGNSFKFTPKGGRISMEASRDGERVLLRFTDTGQGIEPAQMPNLFAKFSELDAERKNGESAGKGLGLSICKAIVEAHGGDIRVESERGKGTTVSVRLPLRQGGVRLDNPPSKA